ncbi:RidA family protein [Croceicoccus sp. F390]|uniref:RidA family protein n=1 Tax=Croceicoccus esteveae TaxID=3075597 RepID=A0ABU2ZKF9_9SPHN|nr:RidA family protein [Croceicoccus sp. F390]MDT0577090.1 RidA family protein [Croceicoccus sp. F390]
MMTEAAMADDHGYSDAVKAGDLLFCSGQVGLEADGGVPADVARQFALAFEALGKVLKANACTADDLVDLTSFHVDYPRHMAEFMAEKSRFLGHARPAWTAVGVAALGYPDTLVEIKAVARLR